LFCNAERKNPCIFVNVGKAANYSNEFSGSQSFCLTFAKDFGIDGETALNLSCAPGGGVAHSGNTCGGASGALMVIGMNHGWNLAAKDQTYEIANTLLKEFLRWKPSLNCADLIGHIFPTTTNSCSHEKENYFKRNMRSSCGMRGRSWRRISDLFFETIPSTLR
jgi:C_GCAxxG_C_C family probable redox protein